MGCTLSNFTKIVIALFSASMLSAILPAVAISAESKGIKISGKPPNRERVVYVYDEATKKWVVKAGSVKPSKNAVAGKTPTDSNGYPKPAKKAVKKVAQKPVAKPTKKSAKALAPAKPQRKKQAVVQAPKPRPLPNGSGAVASASLSNAFDGKMVASNVTLDPKYLPQKVNFRTREKTGTIVVDTDKRFLYLVLGWGKARRYGVGVGQDALSWSGSAKIGKKAEWPKWTPTNEMIAREPAKFAKFKNGMPGGLDNPLGARALYLHQGRNDTYFRIHGTTAPESIGTASSNGCIRMINEHVMDLYERVPVGTKVVVLSSAPSKILQ